MNQFDLRFSATLHNEVFARAAVAAFVSHLNPAVDALMEVKTLVAEAVSNAIIHGYNEDETKFVYLKVEVIGAQEIELTVQDYGVGISDVEQARLPCFTTRPDQERSGMGFTIMESLADAFQVLSVVGLGTKITLRKSFTAVLEGAK